MDIIVEETIQTIFTPEDVEIKGNIILFMDYRLKLN